ncbi:TrkH family potassium uptake protein [Sphingobacterium psychroaquaticum]|uniref:Trk-type K+ transport system, membrane component n=1 Tax=Sphingobacterium psychroaquaticum TaxID=561061 RepID=A0A1X7KYA1_9SPHI|nr:potassium transporter TrkG [Sphingobacterium psychroaquaticum]QBQ39688.1 ATPase [Sphingobacterium psychroaquaticum]SMG46317.1 Trk-type K+ transport system, membrane component [Sphingobacterium psychroaquaticum]
MERFIELLRYLVKYKNNRIDQMMFYLSLFCICVVIIHIGYTTDAEVAAVTERTILVMFYSLFALTSLRTLATFFVERKLSISQISGLILIAYFMLIAVARLRPEAYFAKQEWVYLGIAILFLSELSRNSLFFDNFYFNPTILFVISFIALILLGTVLLMLPRTTIVTPLNFIDALFMATSAVCITGLSVTDISTNFSTFGQAVVMILIQVGGLGIMTFTGFFGYFFSGGFSYKNQLMFGEILGENKLNDVISTLLTIIFITLLFEFIGGVMIFSSLDTEQFDSLGDRIFFSAFHAISAFCNAGFSILPDGINNIGYRFNYAFQLCLSSLFILGGLGFGTVYNFYTFARHKIKGLVRRLILRKPHAHKPQVFTFNSRFVLLCNAIVVAVATIAYFLLERGSTLGDDSTIAGEWVTSFFMANSSRSAGFNSVDVNFVTAPTLIMIVLLMWIGSSPGSTGGGVKVTTVAVALLNIFSLARGKESIEIHKRRIAAESVNKAFAIILLSVLAIGVSFILLNFTDDEKPMKSLLFEVVSAYTTCGLSLGVTPSLSPLGKVIVISTMFVGRVGMLTLLVAFIKNTRNKSYIYPTEKILF